ncbi:hypothetical protein GCM10010106_07870 [Thermopolyspora flexuosa]|jgi:hypothetical protein|uniref:Uncharacterized protein n=1 Tax=Thermopolyspora flexuosa TaxID=103836 RepID=A0A543IZR3_9ACTN|nr:hypothetical protein [Thermopolyspora flexuosa]TQM76060.1 hypothetical protein FHX40_2784 [Thermopolyspora flexuosa]GGM64365.1 hypothetical protein GCM10010106_07870 [Thermopolyspora flexuosa]
MAKSGKTGNVIDLRTLRGSAGAMSDNELLDQVEEAADDHDGCECSDCGGDVLSFPPVELLPDDRLAAMVPQVPLVRDVRRLAEWTGTRSLTVEGLLEQADVDQAAADLGIAPDRVRLLWVVAVNTGLVQITRDGAAPGRGLPDETLEFWDGVIMDVLDRAEDELTGSPVVDEHLAEMLATMYAMTDGITVPALAEGMLQAHEIGCGAGPEEMRELRERLPGDLAAAVELLEYCGLFERHGGDGTVDAVRLTPLGVWAVRQDLLREGHDAPLLADVAHFAELTAAELIEAMLSGEAPASAAGVWVERRTPEDAARELIKVAAGGTAGHRGVIGTILEELGPEAEPAVREALAEPMMWRHAAVWLGVRDLDAPSLTDADNVWLAVDTLATLLHLGDVSEALGEFDSLESGEELLRLVDDMAACDHPDTLAVLELLAEHHPDPAVGKAARKAVMKVRSR